MTLSIPLEILNKLKLISELIKLQELNQIDKALDILFVELEGCLIHGDYNVCDSFYVKQVSLD